MKGKALLFGLNYSYCKEGQLQGCINDVQTIGKYIEATLDIPTSIYTDDIDTKNTSYNGIIKNLYDLAVSSYRDNLEFVWIHYSGHGSYQRDVSGDEADGMDEGLVPSDYEKRGILIDDIINHVLSLFNTRTKILFVCDSCHSGSILDLKYSWNTRRQSKIENRTCRIQAPTMLISGCMDSQTSADAYNLLGDYKHIGALTASILKILDRNPNYVYDAFAFVDAVRLELRRGRFEQYPILSTNYDISINPAMVPVQQQASREMQEEYAEAPRLFVKNIHQPVQTLYRPVPKYPQQIPMQTVQVPQQVPMQAVQVPMQIVQVPQQVPMQPVYIIKMPQPYQVLSTRQQGRQGQPVYHTIQIPTNQPMRLVNHTPLQSQESSNDVYGVCV